MHPKFQKLLEKKKKEGKSLSDVEKEAKMGVVDDMKKMAMDEMSNDLHRGLKKVTVASGDKEGLKKGLDKAKELLDKAPGEEESPEHEAQESSEEEAAEHEEPGLEDKNEDDIDEDDSVAPGDEQNSPRPLKDLSDEELDREIERMRSEKAKREASK